MIELTQEQAQAYNRYIKIRNKIGIVRTKDFSKNPWVRHADVVCTIDLAGMGHPLFEQNDDYLEYQEAFKAWLAVEPEFRKAERMSSIRGDYGTSDNWEEHTPRMRDIYSMVQGETE